MRKRKDKEKIRMPPTIAIIMLFFTLNYLSNFSVKCSLESDNVLFETEQFWNLTMSGEVLALDISEDGNYIVAGTGGGRQGIDNKVYLFNTRTNPTLLWTYQCSSAVREVSISARGDYVVVGTESGEIHLFKRTSNASVWINNLSKMITSTDISSEGHYIAVAAMGVSNGSVVYDTGEVYFFDNTGIILWSTQINSFVEDVSMSSSGDLIAVGAHDGIYIFNKTGGMLFNYTTTRWVLSVEMSSQRSYVVAATGVNGVGNATVYLFDLQNTSVVWCYDNQNSSAFWDVDISATGNYVVAGDMGATGISNATVILFHDKNSTPLWCFETTISQGPIYVSISYDGSYVAVGCVDKIYYFNRASNVPVWTYSAKDLATNETVEIHRLGISSDGRYVVAGTWGGVTQYLYLFRYQTAKFNLTIYVYDVETNKSIAGAFVAVHYFMRDAFFSNTTNSTGYAVFLLDEDEYYIVVESSNYVRYTSSPFTLSENKSFNIPLTPIYENSPPTIEPIEKPPERGWWFISADGLVIIGVISAVILVIVVLRKLKGV